MEESEIPEHENNKDTLIQIYIENNINFTKQLPLSPINMSEQMEEVMTAAQYLNDLANTKDLNVFIHSMSGITRPTTVLLAFYALYKNHKHWKDIDKMAQWLKKVYP